MTREEQIIEYANSFKGKVVESDELKEVIRLAIIDGATWADRHPAKPTIPSALDEAAEEYLKQYNESEFGNGGDDWDDDIIITFKAGAEWMAGQGESFETEIINVGVLSLPELKIQAGDRVIVQIRKK